jgi:hypothetical protein
MGIIANTLITSAMLLGQMNGIAVPKSPILQPGIPMGPGCTEFWANSSLRIEHSKDERLYFYFDTNNIFGHSHNIFGKYHIYTAFTLMRGTTVRLDIPSNQNIITGVPYFGSMGELDSLTNTQIIDESGNTVSNYKFYVPEAIEPAIITFVSSNPDDKPGQLVIPANAHGIACPSPTAGY